MKHLPMKMCLTFAYDQSNIGRLRSLVMKLDQLKKRLTGPLIVPDPIKSPGCMLHPVTEW